MKIYALLITVLLLSNCSPKSNESYLVLEPQINYSKNDSCSLNKITLKRIYIFSKVKEEIRITYNNKSKKVEFFGTKGNWHSEVSIKLEKPSDSLSVINNTRKEYFRLPILNTFDCIGISYQNQLDTVFYYKSCNEFWR